MGTRDNPTYEREFRNAATTQVPRSEPFKPHELNPARPDSVEVPDIERVPARYVAIALTRLHAQVSAIAKMIGDYSRPVDEYRPQVPLSGDSETTFQLQPQWETPEIIRSIIITGPTGSITLQLGDRVWSLTIPASGIIVISPIAVMLERSDLRILTASVTGQYTLELMGNCDDRT
jgi:hypothetical protein